MSIQAVGWVLEQSESRGFPRLVMIALANHANDTHECWPSQRTIAREAGVSTGMVPKAVAELVDLGEIEIVAPGDARRSTRYRLRFPQRSPGEHSPDDERSPGERSARSMRERSAHAMREQNHQEPSRTVNAAEPRATSCPHGCVNGWIDDGDGHEARLRRCPHCQPPPTGPPPTRRN